MSSQDQLFAKTAHLTAKKQEGLRVKIIEEMMLIVGSSFMEGQLGQVVTTPKNLQIVADSILQQVIGWVDTESKKIEHEKYGGYDNCVPECFACAVKDFAHNLISQLKGELS